MFRHRLAKEADYYRLPELPAPRITAAGFQVCPTGVLCTCTCTPDHMTGVAQLYQWAFVQAQAVARPAVVEREVFALWN